MIKLIWPGACVARAALVIAAAAVLSRSTAAQWTPDTEAKAVAAVQKVMAETGVPSASVGIVQDGRIVYTHAFGEVRLAPPTPADAAIAYPVGSISKQFTATAVLLLQQDGKLRLDDPVGKYFPELTRANEITLRNLLTHTSGYQDYAPQDYTIPRWLKPEDPLNVVREFAGKPLDFEPGTEWQYSNTNFVLAALIVQKVSGVPFAQFLRDRVLAPARLGGVLNLNTDQKQLQVTGYLRNALAPLRPATLEAPGWYFGDGDLAMPVSSLLTWDTTFLNQSILSPASYTEMETPFLLKSGRSSNYGLGIFIRNLNGQKAIEHSGEVGGFVAENIVLPDSHAAIAVLTNQEASSAASQIARALLPLVLGPGKTASASDATASSLTPQLKVLLADLVQGKLDRTLLTSDCSSYFDKNAIADFQSSLSPLGTVTNVAMEASSLRGGMTFGSYKATFSGGTSVRLSVYITAEGKIEQFLVEGKE